MNRIAPNHDGSFFGDGSAIEISGDMNESKVSLDGE
jgi:hypothetical protein